MLTPKEQVIVDNTLRILALIIYGTEPEVCRKELIKNMLDAINAKVIEDIEDKP